MKAMHLLKLATVVLALGSLPVHTAFASDDVAASEAASSEAVSSEAASQGQDLASAESAESPEALG